MAYGLCTVGINQVMMCSPCFYMLNQISAIAYGNSGVTEGMQKTVIKECRASYVQAKKEFLVRLQKNVDEIISIEESELEEDADSLAQEIKDFFGLRAAEKKVEIIKKRSR